MTVSTSTDVATERIRAIARKMTEVTAIVASRWWPRSIGWRIFSRETIVRWPRANLCEMGDDGFTTFAPM
jgi:hypothetical protein